MKKLTALLVLVLAAATFTACGDDSDSDTSATAPATTTEASGGQAQGGKAGGSTVTLEADPDGALAYVPDSASASAGNVTIKFDNPQPLEHDVVVEDSSGEDIGETELVSSDSTSTTLQGMKPGDYTFYCSVPGHREAGMEGTLTVK